MEYSVDGNQLTKVDETETVVGEVHYIFRST